MHLMSLRPENSHERRGEGESVSRDDNLREGSHGEVAAYDTCRTALAKYPSRPPESRELCTFGPSDSERQSR
jgi:hypothetical protein